jgi:hypothetical protein
MLVCVSWGPFFKYVLRIMEQLSDKVTPEYDPIKHSVGHNMLHDLLDAPKMFSDHIHQCTVQCAYH